MPWLETSPVEQRERFIRDHRLELYSMVELCTRYGISRKTGYKWLDRFEDCPARFARTSRRHQRWNHPPEWRQGASYCSSQSRPQHQRARSRNPCSATTRFPLYLEHSPRSALLRRRPSAIRRMVWLTSVSTAAGGRRLHAGVMRENRRRHLTTCRI